MYDQATDKFIVTDISSGVRRFAADGTFDAADIATFPDDLRNPAIVAASLHTASPTTGSIAGGVEVTLTGTGFTLLGATPTVSFGTATAVGTVVDDQHMTVLAPIATAPGIVDITIDVAAYRYAWPKSFTYVDALPLKRTGPKNDAVAASDDSESLACNVGGRGNSVLMLLSLCGVVAMRRRR
jgi:hypothetical protein